jgi:hypothetical protein
MWQYQLDDDHFYDLRDLPVGGWLGSKLTRSVDGKWASFSAPHRRYPYNTAHPIDYQKRYVPPSTSLDHALPPITPSPSIPEFELNRRSLTALNEEDSIRNPPIFEITAPTRPRTTNTGSLRDHTISRPKTRPATTGSFARDIADFPVNVKVLENPDLPDREVEWARCRGTEIAGRSPFRISQIELRRQFKAAWAAEQTGTHHKGRPATTSAMRRIPNLAKVYGSD